MGSCWVCISRSNIGRNLICRNASPTLVSLLLFFLSCKSWYHAWHSLSSPVGGILIFTSQFFDVADAFESFVYSLESTAELIGLPLVAWVSSSHRYNWNRHCKVLQGTTVSSSTFITLASLGYVHILVLPWLYSWLDRAVSTCIGGWRFKGPRLQSNGLCKWRPHKSLSSKWVTCLARATGEYGAVRESVLSPCVNYERNGKDPARLCSHQ